MLFGNKFKKLKRDEVVTAICELEQQEQSLEAGMISKQAEIDSLMEKGKVEKSRDLKLFYAKKITFLKNEKTDDIQKGMYLMYNISLMRKLKNSIDDNNFIVNVGKLPLNKLLRNQKQLAQFLNKALNTKIKSEDIMTNTDQTFVEVKNLYEPNAEIYGVNKNDDQLLAMFETEESLNMQEVMFDGGVEKKEEEPQKESLE